MAVDGESVLAHTKTAAGEQWWRRTAGIGGGSEILGVAGACARAGLDAGGAARRPAASAGGRRRASEVHGRARSRKGRRRRRGATADSVAAADSSV
jgi:hypothetical protein